MATDAANAVNSTPSKGFFNTLYEKQQKACNKLGEHLVLVKRLGLTNLAIRLEDSGDKKADSTLMKVVKFIASFLLALPVLALFGALTLGHKAGCMIKTGFTNVKDWISGAKKQSEEKSKTEKTSEEKKTVEITTESTTETSESEQKAANDK